MLPALVTPIDLRLRRTLVRFVILFNMQLSISKNIEELSQTCS